MNDDMELLREFAVSHSEQAFETLVSRYVHLVHSAALRQVGNAHRAEDITQTVFIILARKAEGLSPKTILAGWLYRTTLYACRAAIKIQHRRERREREAHMETLIHETQSETAWERLSPLLDEAMSKLRETDRDALVLRYFQNKSLREVGAALGVEQHAAQKRVQRALERLRGLLQKRGAVSTSDAIAQDLSVNSIQTAPGVLVKSIVAVASAKGAAAGGSTLTIIQGTLKLMAWTKAKTAAVAGVAIILAIATTTTTALLIRHARMPKPIVPAAAGYATPEATCQTMLWAASHGDVKMFLATLSPAVQKHFVEVQMKGKSETEISEAIQRKAGKMGDVSLVAQRPGVGGSSVLQLRFRKQGNYTQDWLRMSNVGGEWKIDNL